MGRKMSGLREGARVPPRHMSLQDNHIRSRLPAARHGSMPVNRHGSMPVNRRHMSVQETRRLTRLQENKRHMSMQENRRHMSMQDNRPHMSMQQNRRHMSVQENRIRHGNFQAGNIRQQTRHASLQENQFRHGSFQAGGIPSRRSSNTSSAREISIGSVPLSASRRTSRNPSAGTLPGFPAEYEPYGSRRSSRQVTC